MTESNLILILTSIPTLLAATGSTVVSIITAMRVERVHTLVNSQYTSLLQRNLEALEKIASIEPTSASIRDVAVAKQIVDDHKTV